MTDKEVMQMALDWFHWFQHGTNPNGAHVLQVEEALRAALAQPEPEPVAYLTKRKISGTEGLLRADMVDMSAKNKETHDFIPLYTAPPQRKPLTDEEIFKCINATASLGKGHFLVEFANAIEAAHGIG